MAEGVAGLTPRGRRVGPQGGGRGCIGRRPGQDLCVAARGTRVAGAVILAALAGAASGCRGQPVAPADRTVAAATDGGGAAFVPSPADPAPELTTATQLLRGLAAVEGREQWRVLLNRFPGPCRLDPAPRPARSERRRRPEPGRRPPAVARTGAELKPRPDGGPELDRLEATERIIGCVLRCAVSAPRSQAAVPATPSLGSGRDSDATAPLAADRPGRPSWAPDLDGGPPPVPQSARAWRQAAARCGDELFGGPALRSLAGPATAVLGYVQRSWPSLLDAARAAGAGEDRLRAARHAAASLELELGLPAELILDDGQTCIAPSAHRRLASGTLPRLIVLLAADGRGRVLIAPTARLREGRAALVDHGPWTFPGRPIAAGEQGSRSLAWLQELRGAQAQAERALAEQLRLGTEGRRRPQVGLYVDAQTPLFRLRPVFTALAALGDLELLLLVRRDDEVAPLRVDPVRLRKGPLGYRPSIYLAEPPRLRLASGHKRLATWADLVDGVAGAGLPVRLELPSGWLRALWPVPGAEQAAQTPP